MAIALGWEAMALPTPDVLTLSTLDPAPTVPDGQREVGVYATDTFVTVDPLTAGRFGLDPSVMNLDPPAMASTPEGANYIFDNDRPFNPVDDPEELSCMCAPLHASALGITFEAALAITARFELDGLAQQFLVERERLLNADELAHREVHLSLLGRRALDELDGENSIHMTRETKAIFKDIARSPRQHVGRETPVELDSL